MTPGVAASTSCEPGSTREVDSETESCVSDSWELRDSELSASSSDSGSDNLSDLLTRLRLSPA